MFKVLSDEEIAELVDKTYKETGATDEDRAKAVAKTQHKDTLRQVVEWGNERCQGHRITAMGIIKRRKCNECWQSLQQAIEEGK